MISRWWQTTTKAKFQRPIDLQLDDATDSYHFSEPAVCFWLTHVILEQSIWQTKLGCYRIPKRVGQLDKWDRWNDLCRLTINIDNRDDHVDLKESERWVRWEPNIQHLSIAGIWSPCRSCKLKLTPRCTDCQICVRGRDQCVFPSSTERVSIVGPIIKTRCVLISYI